jgi:hypothetical protein
MKLTRIVALAGMVALAAPVAAFAQGGGDRVVQAAACRCSCKALR